MAQESGGERMEGRQISSGEQQQGQTGGSSLQSPPDGWKFDSCPVGDMVGGTIDGASSVEELSPANRDFFFKYGFLKYPARKRLRRPSGSGSSRLVLNPVLDSVPVKCAVDKRRRIHLGRQHGDRQQPSKKAKTHEDGLQQRL